MRWQRPVKYDLIQLSAAPATPKSEYSLASKVLWSMVSKAALRSSETRTVGWLLSAAEYMLLREFRRAVSVEWHYL
jgi:hypothetical protein